MATFTFQFHRTLMRVFPDAKVLLTVRDAERWYESVKGSIYTANNYNQGTVGLFLKLVGQFRRMNIVLSTSNQGPPVNEKGKHVLIFFRVRIYIKLACTNYVNISHTYLSLQASLIQLDSAKVNP